MDNEETFYRCAAELNQICKAGGFLWDYINEIEDPAGLAFFSKDKVQKALAVLASRLVDPSRIALNPDCGFAPDYGEPPSIDEAYDKLCRLSEAATRLRERYA